MPKGKQGTEHTLVRRMLIVHRLPGGDRSAAAGMTVREILAYLAVEGIECGKRTVERDLVAINEDPSIWRRFGVELRHASREGLADREACWSHAPNSKGVFLRAMTDEQALMLSLVEQELKHFLPPSAYQLIRSFFTVAEGVLAQPSNARQARFKERVRVIAEGPEVGGPPVDVAHLEEINEALLRDEQLDLRYWSSKNTRDNPYQLHAIGLVKQGRFFWLLAVKHENTRSENLLDYVQTFRVDRIRQLARRSQEVADQRLPTLDQALDSGKLSFFSTGMIDLRLRFVNSRAGLELCENYRDTPLDHDQTIVAIAEGGRELRARVRYTRQLVWSLQRAAHLVRVESPPQLRDEIIAFTEGAAQLQLNVGRSRGP